MLSDADNSHAKQGIPSLWKLFLSMRIRILIWTLCYVPGYLAAAVRHAKFSGSSSSVLDRDTGLKLIHNLLAVHPLLESLEILIPYPGCHSFD